MKEVNFDGLIGPTHNYAGLALGNLASAKNAMKVAYPKQAALQGLSKMRHLMSLGYTQGFLPPQQRPQLSILRQLGFEGTDEQIIEKAYKKDLRMLALVYSASSMWAANAATVTPALDAEDGRTHFTPANLLTTSHRSFEHFETERALRTIFADTERFAVHPALFSQSEFADEGAANHTRLCSQYGDKGIGLFVFGRDGQSGPTRFPGRQTRLASELIADQHQLGPHAVFLQQNPDAIDSGAFHNDVVAVGNGPLLFHHELAFRAEDMKKAFEEIRAKVPEFQSVCVPSDRVSIQDAIQSYLFNSQLLAGPNGNMTNMRLIAPTESQYNPNVSAYLSELTQDRSQPIRHVDYVDVRESMSNGGGPACLRLRVLLSDSDIEAVHPAFILTPERIEALEQWVRHYYRDELSPNELADPALLRESYEALDALTKVLGIGNFYAFQQ